MGLVGPAILSGGGKTQKARYSRRPNGTLEIAYILHHVGHGVEHFVGQPSMPLPSVGDAIDIADKLGVFQAVKDRLVKQPDPAANKLVIALEEISKIHTDIEKELVGYLSLDFDTWGIDSSDQNIAFKAREDIKKQRSVLLSLGGGQIIARMAEAKGSCSKISNIYVRYLDPWFQRALKGDDDSQKELGELFAQMHEYDGDMMKGIDGE